MTLQAGLIHYWPTHFQVPEAKGEPLTGRLTPPIGAEFIDVVMGDDDQLVILSSDAGYGFISSLESAI